MNNKQTIVDNSKICYIPLEEWNPDDCATDQLWDDVKGGKAECDGRCRYFNK